MSGHWPPEWDDPDDSIPGEAGKPDTEAEARLFEVAVYLASVPAAPMPGSVEARISAALAVEAASRAGIAARTDGDVQAHRAAPAKETAGPRVLAPVPAQRGRAQARARARILRRGAPGQRDRRRALGQFVLGPLVVCLLLAGIGFGLSRAGSSSSSSSANSVAGLPAAGTRYAGAGSQLGPEATTAASAASSATSAASSAAPALTSTPAATGTSAASGTSAGFVVSATGTKYQRATLAQQAHAQLLAAQAREAVPSAAPTASSPSSAVPSPSGPSPSGPSPSGPSPSGPVRTYAAPPQLRACVLTVTGGVLPELVDRATYQGTPVYVIASSSRVWVVGLGCTVAKPEVITSQPLAG